MQQNPTCCCLLNSVPKVIPGYNTANTKFQCQSHMSVDCGMYSESACFLLELDNKFSIILLGSCLNCLTYPAVLLHNFFCFQYFFFAIVFYCLLSFLRIHVLSKTIFYDKIQGWDVVIKCLDVEIQENLGEIG